MAYNPQFHHRKSIRLKGFDYSQPGSYFITICTQDRKCVFGRITKGEMVLNKFGMIAYQKWDRLPDRFTGLGLDVFQIMPNHMHGIITLTGVVGATLAAAPSHAVAPSNAVDPSHAPAPTLAVAPSNAVDSSPRIDRNFKTRDEISAVGAGASPAPTNIATVSNIIGAYKSLTTNDCLDLIKQQCPDKIMGKLWHRNYYEHIIRDEKSHKRISDYIINNPKNWKEDPFKRM